MTSNKQALEAANEILELLEIIHTDCIAGNEGISIDWRACLNDSNYEEKLIGIRKELQQPDQIITDNSNVNYNALARIKELEIELGRLKNDYEIVDGGRVNLYKHNQELKKKVEELEARVEELYKLSCKHIDTIDALNRRNKID